MQQQTPHPQTPPFALQRRPWGEGRMLQQPPSLDQSSKAKQQGGQDTLGRPFPNTLSGTAQKPLPQHRTPVHWSSPHRDPHSLELEPVRCWMLCLEPARSRDWLGRGNGPGGMEGNSLPCTKPQTLLVKGSEFPSASQPPAMTSCFPSSTAADLAHQQPQGKGDGSGARSCFLLHPGGSREARAGAGGTEVGSAEPRRK